MRNFVTFGNFLGNTGFGGDNGCCCNLLVCFNTFALFDVKPSVVIIVVARFDTVFVFTLCSVLVLDIFVVVVVVVVLVLVVVALLL